MSIKKIVLLASMALAAAAFAMPASASAAEELITDEGKAATGTLELTGPVRYELLGAGIECQSHAAIEFVNGKAWTDGFSLTTSTCHGYGISWKNCIVTEDSVTLPTKPLSGVTTKTEGGEEHTGLTLKEGVIHKTMTATPATSCPFVHVTETLTDVHLYPTNKERTKTQRKLDTIEIAGSVLISTDTGKTESEAAARGYLSPEKASDEGTYELALV